MHRPRAGSRVRICGCGGALAQPRALSRLPPSQSPGESTIDPCSAQCAGTRPNLNVSAQYTRYVVALHTKAHDLLPRTLGEDPAGIPEDDEVRRARIGGATKPHATSPMAAVLGVPLRTSKEESIITDSTTKQTKMLANQGNGAGRSGRSPRSGPNFGERVVRKVAPEGGALGWELHPKVSASGADVREEAGLECREPVCGSSKPEPGEPHFRSGIPRGRNCQAAQPDTTPVDLHWNAMKLTLRRNQRCDTWLRRIGTSLHRAVAF